MLDKLDPAVIAAIENCQDAKRQQDVEAIDRGDENEICRADYHKDAAHGHRPTWKTGTNADLPGGDKNGTRTSDSQKFAEARAQRTQNFYAWRAQKAREDAIEPKRRVKPLQQKSLDVLGLPDTATKAEVKSRYKDLVKTHHPDVNGGDRSSEDKLREIIQAYNLLKQAGLG